jgi:hypothetical protein
MGQMSTSAETPLCLLGDEQALQALEDRIVARYVKAGHEQISIETHDNQIG